MAVHVLEEAQIEQKQRAGMQILLRYQLAPPVEWVL
jgi:hypothetical protein